MTTSPTRSNAQRARVLNDGEKEMLERAFKVLDVDGSGKLDGAELAQLLRVLDVRAEYESGGSGESSVSGSGAGEFVERILKTVDTDGDNELSLDEVIEMVEVG